MPCLSSLLEIAALIASLMECKQAIISSQEDKQDIKFKEVSIKYYKEKKLLLLLMSGVTFHFSSSLVEIEFAKLNDWDYIITPTPF